MLASDKSKTDRVLFFGRLIAEWTHGGDIRIAPRVLGPAFVHVVVDAILKLTAKHSPSLYSYVALQIKEAIVRHQPTESQPNELQDKPEKNVAMADTYLTKKEKGEPPAKIAKAS